MANNKLSRSQKELHRRLLGATITRFVGGGLDDSYHPMSSKCLQQRTVEQWVSQGYLIETSRAPMNGGVEKIEYIVVDPNAVILNPTATQIVNAEHTKLRKVEAMEILQGGGFYEEVSGSRYQVSYFMGQLRLNAAWHNDWHEKGLVESYDREYVNGTFRGCKWRVRK